MQKLSLLMLFLLSIFYLPLSYGQSITHNKFDNIIVFGDSLSDIGNNHWVKVAGTVGAPITSVDPKTHIRALWINQLIKQIFPGKALYSSSQIQASDPINMNIDYAYASAETGDNYLNDLAPNAAFPPYDDNACDQHGPGVINDTLACVPGMVNQVNRYLSGVAFQPNKRSLFILWAGGNDIFNNIAKIVSKTPANKVNETVIFSQLTQTLSTSKSKNAKQFSHPIANILAARKLLLKAGVPSSHIYVINLPDLSKTPAAKSFAKGNKILLGIISAITRLYNTSLWLAIPPRPQDGFTSHVYSVAKLFGAIVKNPSQYGFNNVADSCVADQQDPYCTHFLFFNDKHPTVALGKILANDMQHDLIKN